MYEIKQFKNRLNGIGCGDKIEDIVKIFNESFNLKISVSEEDHFDKLPINVLEYIISLIPDINNIKKKCMYRSCNTIWKQIIDNTKIIEISDKNIIKSSISHEYLLGINDKIINLNIKLDHTPHAIRAKILFNFIKQFSKLEELTICTWKSYTANDLKILLRIDVGKLKIIDNNTNLAVFYLDEKKLRIFKTIYDTDILKEKYSDIEILFSDMHFALNDQWSWFKGELYINIPFNYRSWMNSCKAIHILDPTCNPYRHDIITNVNSFRNLGCFRTYNCSTNVDNINYILKSYHNVKTIKLKNYKGDHPDNFNIISNEYSLDLLELGSTRHHFNLENISIHVKCYQITAPKINIHPDLHSFFHIVDKKTYCQLTRRY